MYLRIALVVSAAICAVSSQDQCQTFAGGYVYPQELRPASGHKIQWSKALSKLVKALKENQNYFYHHNDYHRTTALTKTNDCAVVL